MRDAGGPVLPKCVICGKKAPKEEMYRPPSSLRYTCSPHINPECAMTFSKQLLAKKKETAEKEFRMETKRRKAIARESDTGYWRNKAQAAFNAFIRARDKGNPCISCDRNTGAKMNAGHYLSRGAHPELAFDENNCHLQCEHCNSYKSGNQIEYRKRLKVKIGPDALEALEGPHEPLRYRVNDYKAIEAKYKQKLKEFNNG